jgi:hypothetical protein
MADNDDSSSSSSDNEFLTKGDVDREALVRKKLLESFYGKTAVAPSLEPGHTEDDLVEEERTGDYMENNRRKTRIDDLDSKDFDAKRYTEYHIRSSSVHDLLTIEEKLALEVRTLDSTMQVHSVFP